MPKLTKRIVDTLKADITRDIFVWDEGDGSLKGFGIRLKPSGISSYIVQYRNAEGRTRRMVIGRVGVITPEQARERAREKLTDASAGKDPSALRHANRKGIDMAELCDMYLKIASEWVKPSTLAMDKSRINTHVKPLIGTRLISGLKKSDIEKMQLDIASGKTAKKRNATGRYGLTSGGKGVAARTTGMVATILQFAVDKNMITLNPARGIRKYQDRKVIRYLNHDEIKKLGIILREMEKNPFNSSAVAIIRILLMTGCRRNEILSASAHMILGLSA